MNAEIEVNQTIAAFRLGLDIAALFKLGVYDELEEDDLGSLIGALICERVLNPKETNA